MNIEIMEQLRMLKGLTIRFGCLHEAQVHQLKVYPKLITGIQDSTAHINPDTRTVQFECSGRQIKKTKKRLKEMIIITEWIRTLLWDDTVVVFEINGKILYDSKFDFEAAADPKEH